MTSTHVPIVKARERSAQIALYRVMYSKSGKSSMAGASLSQERLTDSRSTQQQDCVRLVAVWGCDSTCRSLRGGAGLDWCWCSMCVGQYASLACNTADLKGVGWIQL
ncbi:hypothetical protein Tco_1174879 [Tanacetum coccineum]